MWAAGGLPLPLFPCLFYCVFTSLSAHPIFHVMELCLTHSDILFPQSFTTLTPQNPPLSSSSFLYLAAISLRSHDACQRHKRLYSLPIFTPRAHPPIPAFPDLSHMLPRSNGAGRSSAPAVVTAHCLIKTGILTSRKVLLSVKVDRHL